MLKDKILVGHALKNDLDVLMLSHPRTMIRDTARYRPYMRVSLILHVLHHPRTLHQTFSPSQTNAGARQARQDPAPGAEGPD